MVNIKKKIKINKYLFYAYFIGFVSFLLYSIFFKISAYVDVIVCFGLYLPVFFLYRKYRFSAAAFLFMIIGISLHLLGSLGLYSYFLFGPIGYDKLVHIFSSFAGAYAFLTSNIDKDNVLRYLIIILMVMGFGALVEINEFVGSTYLSINQGGILTQGDGLPMIKSDLQRYDTYFDMIFNLAGVLSCVFFMISRKIIRNKYF